MPAWLEHVARLWTNPAAYNFASSEWGGLVFHAVEFLIAMLVIRWLLKPLMARVHRHLECDVAGCSKWGRPVHGTSHRACHEHHPHLLEDGHTPAQINQAAQHGHDTRPV